MLIYLIVTNICNYNIWKKYFLLRYEVSDSQQNINVLRGLVLQLQKLVSQENQKCWGKPLGSEILWKGHVETIQRIQKMATQIKITEVNCAKSIEIEIDDKNNNK